MKTTPFTQFHIDRGAKMHEFAGYNMPIEYSGIKDEHLAVRNNVGVFDVSHMGEIWVKGKRALEFIQKVSSNDASKLNVGDAHYSCFPNGEGGIVDDLLVYFFEPNKYLLVVNASNIEKDWNWLMSQNDLGVELENASDRIAQLAIQGPNAEKVLQTLTDVDLSAIKYYTFKVGTFAEIDNVIISATGYTGSGGFEIYFYNNDGKAIWNALFEAGKAIGIKPIGLGARDTLRLEKGYCLYGNDINDTTSPIEASLGWITKFTDEKNLIDKEFLLGQKKNGVDQKLKGFKLIDRGIPRNGYTIVDAEGNEIGRVTSGTMSPILNVGIGMGYIQTPQSKIGNTIYIKVRNKTLKAEVVKLPFL